MNLELESVIKILIAVLVGGFIGLERESANRPAGLRTHILVCVASALVMDMNILLAREFINTDPVRLGAQVISGMGFLGAGTIIKEGVNVRGLTTAAGLWAVACLGLVIGAGFYLLAVFASLVMLITLKTFNQLEQKYTKHKRPPME
ncbi:MgtC/SapB family protein [Fusibacter bizertensis]|uniref:MgtC/SapB family protein n=1 Tax=Fusibacter bizertensis TaxID=1488331 RepID=A0ABT6NFC7_9FIRM|nr:MgtC/SapB family protein [Fusibacter bizertensis]MDH8679133.1 MgtC/SapB family protein [Fusibacter bizertensis]